MGTTTKLRTLRVPEDGRWERASERAEQEGITVSAALNDFLLRYSKGKARPPRQ